MPLITVIHVFGMRYYRSARFVTSCPTPPWLIITLIVCEAERGLACFNHTISSCSLIPCHTLDIALPA